MESDRSVLQWMSLRYIDEGYGTSNMWCLKRDNDGRLDYAFSAVTHRCRVLEKKRWIGSLLILSRETTVFGANCRQNHASFIIHKEGLGER